jgi:hypothetical protein
LKGKFVTLLDVEEPQSIKFSGAKGGDTGVVVRIKSFRRFKIEKAEFKFSDGGAGMDWKTVFPVKYEVSLVDSAKTQKGKEDVRVKPFVYLIRLHLNSELKTDQWGEIVLTTDLKERKEIKISGVIEAKK